MSAEAFDNFVTLAAAAQPPVAYLDLVPRARLRAAAPGQTAGQDTLPTTSDRHAAPDRFPRVLRALVAATTKALSAGFQFAERGRRS